MKIITNKLKCLKCGDIIESTYGHDFKFCSCKNIFVDGGHNYLRRGGNGLMDKSYEELSDTEEDKEDKEDEELHRKSVWHSHREKPKFGGDYIVYIRPENVIGHWDKKRNIWILPEPYEDLDPEMWCEIPRKDIPMHLY